MKKENEEKLTKLLADVKLSESSAGIGLKGVRMSNDDAPPKR